ncbi:GNAT family N-acetyltransferase [Mycolicibacterium cosmeticum]|uniref:Acetyltransferase n=1 Tax=Mycolicibacterium cosmeticum TaxID=258533 RepID=W9B0Y9_MYCCO|nr:GNAT family N-acetyltransferase [Mycolicibacterium cosmeticum]TLH70651.1 GNAT family N-acetyltransferase [Mycolicibacterium cosmeticum]CDO11463.1 acetyltransferase [Mycolicibacterium cosmeticum]
MVNVRNAVPADALAVAQTHVRSWQVGYKGLIAQAYLDRLRPEERAARYRFDKMDPVNGPYTLVAVDEDVVCGHVTVGRSRDRDHDQLGEIWSLYVDPPHWGSGVGSTLLAAGCRQLRQAGYGSAYLWVLSTNVRARRFYARAGWIIEGSERTDFVGGKYIAEIKYELRIDAEDVTKFAM